MDNNASSAPAVPNPGPISEAGPAVDHTAALASISAGVSAAHSKLDAVLSVLGGVVSKVESVAASVVHAVTPSAPAAPVSTSNASDAPAAPPASSHHAALNSILDRVAGLTSGADADRINEVLKVIAELAGIVRLFV